MPGFSYKYEGKHLNGPKFGKISAKEFSTLLANCCKESPRKGSLSESRTHLSIRLSKQICVRWLKYFIKNINLRLFLKISTTSIQS